MAQWPAQTRLLLPYQGSAGRAVHPHCSSLTSWQGSITASSALALLQVGAPEQVRVTVDGEALIDDGVAAVLFSVFLVRCACTSCCN